MSVSRLHLRHKPCTDAGAHTCVLHKRRHPSSAMQLVPARHTDDRRIDRARTDQQRCRAVPESEVVQLAQLAEELPSELPPFNEDVLLPLLFFTAPLCIYLAIRLLLWDYKERPEDPRELKEGPYSEQKAKPADQRTYSWGAQPKPAQVQLAPAEAVSESAGALVFQAVMASQRLLRIRCAQDFLTAQNNQPGASWCWAACLLGLPEPQSDCRHQVLSGSSPVNIAADLAHRVVVSMAGQLLEKSRSVRM